MSHQRNTRIFSSRWALFVLLLVAGFLAFSGWSFYRAAQGTSAVTDRDYYSHGLRFNQTLLEQQAAATLGWTPFATLEDRQLRVLLRDQRQQAVSSASGTLTIMATSRSEPLKLKLTEEAPGIYLVQLPLSLHGDSSAQLDFERAGARMSKRLLLALP